MTSTTPKPAPARCAALAAFLLLLTPALTAQNSGRGFLKAQGGATFGTINTDPAGAAGFGVRINGFADLFAEAGAINDVMTPRMKDELDAILALLSLDLGYPVSFDTKVPVQYTIFGSRFTVPFKSALTPFFEVAGGISRTSFSNVEALISGIDVSPVVRSEISQETFADFMFSASAGVHIAVTRRFGIDVGYRYFRISTDPPAPIAGMFYTGIVYRF